MGLLNNGAEECKGDEVHKEAYAFMSKSNTFNFCGNVEGRDVLSGEADVVVADGFSGNVALKSIEGTALGVFKLIKKVCRKAASRQNRRAFVQAGFKTYQT